MTLLYLVIAVLYAVYFNWLIKTELEERKHAKQLSKLVTTPNSKLKSVSHYFYHTGYKY